MFTFFKDLAYVRKLKVTYMDTIEALEALNLKHCDLNDLTIRNSIAKMVRAGLTPNQIVAVVKSAENWYEVKEGITTEK